MEAIYAGEEELAGDMLEQEEVNERCQGTFILLSFTGCMRPSR